MEGGWLGAEQSFFGKPAKSPLHQLLAEEARHCGPREAQTSQTKEVGGPGIARSVNPRLGASDSGPVGREEKREVSHSEQTTGEVWRKITWAGTCLPEAGQALDHSEGGFGSQLPAPIYSVARSNFRNPKRWADNREVQPAMLERPPSLLSMKAGMPGEREPLATNGPCTEQAKEGTLEPTLLGPL